VKRIPSWCVQCSMFNVFLYSIDSKDKFEWFSCRLSFDFPKKQSPLPILSEQNLKGDRREKDENKTNCHILSSSAGEERSDEITFRSEASSSHHTTPAAGKLSATSDELRFPIPPEKPLFHFRFPIPLEKAEFQARLPRPPEKLLFQARFNN